ncbi:sorting nexin 1 [Senna tora]|uniref:Sorting nexin 1 n=1 Tax=Senna tora TaxID=362788 RepID=A0A834W0J1_9FABA|nr:sorting nexin 1 [Senna tora]
MWFSVLPRIPSLQAHAAATSPRRHQHHRPRADFAKGSVSWGLSLPGLGVDGIILDADENGESHGFRHNTDPPRPPPVWQSDSFNKSTMPEFLGRSKFRRRFLSAFGDAGRRFPASATLTDQRSSASLSSSPTEALEEGGDKVRTRSKRSEEEGDRRRGNPVGFILAMLNMEQQTSLPRSSKSPRPPSSPPFLSVSTIFPEYQGPEKYVKRRYSDFAWLHDCLCEKYKGLSIPSLPEKSAIEKFRFSNDFIETRRQALEIYINKIASHPELQQSQDLRTFLQANEEVIKIPIFGMTIESCPRNDTNDVRSKVSDVVLGKEKPVEESNRACEKLKDYIFKLDKHLDEVLNRSHCLAKMHRELGESWSDFGKAVKLFSACGEHTLGKAFSELGKMSENSLIILKQHAHQFLNKFEEPLNDYFLTVRSIKEKMTEWESELQRQCKQTETLKLKEINLEKLKLSRSEKVREAEREYNDLKAENEQATEKIETIKTSMKENLKCFQKQKTCLANAIHEFVDELQSLLPDLEKIIPPPIDKDCE